MKQVIHSDGAPRAIGPYSQAIGSGHFVFLSGQIGIDPADGKITAPDAAGQTRQAMDNLSAVLQAAGLSVANVVKTTIYLASMDDFQVVNEVYAGYFDGDAPARATVEVSGLPLGARVEVDAIARR